MHCRLKFLCFQKCSDEYETIYVGQTHVKAGSLSDLTKNTIFFVNSTEAGLQFAGTLDSRNSICGTPAWSTSLEDISVVFLDHPSSARDFKKVTTLNSHLGNAIASAIGYSTLETKREINKVIAALNSAQCAAKTQLFDVC